MKKFLKFLLSTLVVVVLLIIIAAVVLPFVIDPNDFKPQITNQVKKVTGRELTLGGDIDLSVFPWLGVELHEVSFSNAPNFGETPFAKATEMEARVKLLPLLQKQVVMDTVVLRDLHLNLARNAQGKTNWEDLMAEKPQQAPPEAKEETPPENAPPPLAGLAIAGLKIEAARVYWRDEVKDVSYTLKQLNLNTDPLVPGEPTDVKLAFDFSSSQPAVNGHLDFRGDVTANLETNHYRVQNTDLKLTAAGEALPIEQLALQLGANIEAFLAKQQVTVSDIQLTSQVKGPRETQLTLNTSLEGDLAAQQYRLKALQLETQVKDPQFPKPLSATLTTTASLDLNQETLKLQDLSLATLGMRLKGNINGSNILTEPNAKGQLVSNEFNPRTIAEKLALDLPPTADASVLNMARLALKFSATPEDFATNALVAKLDESTLKGSLAVRNFQQPAIRFNLALDTINLDRYLPPPSEKEAKPAPPAPPGGSAAATAGALPLETLRALDAKGTLKIDELTAGGVHSEEVRITLGAQDGLVKLHPLYAKLYQGVYTGNVRLDARVDPPKLAIDEKLAGIKAGPLLKDLMGDDKIIGTADVNAQLTATGATPEAIRRTLNGTAGFSFTDGAVKGINIPQLIREAKARLEGKPLPSTKEPEQTDFTTLQGTIKATNGILRNNDLKAQSPFLRVQGQGTANLIQENIDYQLKVALVKTLQGQGGEALTELKGITIPMKISGSFTQPNYGIDLEGIIKAKAEKVIEEKKQVIEKKLEQQLDKLLGTESDQEAAPAKGETPAETPSTPEEQLKEEFKKRLQDFF